MKCHGWDLQKNQVGAAMKRWVAISCWWLKLDAKYKEAHYPFCLFVYFDIFQNKKLKKKMRHKCRCVSSAKITKEMKTENSQAINNSLPTPHSFFFFKHSAVCCFKALGVNLLRGRGSPTLFPAGTTSLELWLCCFPRCSKNGAWSIGGHLRTC